jgi:hypothetical protein
MAVILTETQKTDIRRFCGYPALGDGVTSDFWWRLFPNSDRLESRLNQISPSDLVVLEKILCQLNSLEFAVFNAAQNLDVAGVGPVTMNPRELSQRQGIFAEWRRKLCGFLGIDHGPDLFGGNSVPWMI